LRPQNNDAFRLARARLAESLAGKGICSASVLEALGRVPRHLFVSEALRFRAYEDTALPIGHRQTVTRPSTIARMVQALGLTGGERVLEIGTGSGYQAAVLAELAGTVVSVEIIEELHKRARDILLMELGYGNITLHHSDNFGDTGGNFDAVVVAACAVAVPEELIGRLVPGGVLILPVESGRGQVIKKIVKGADGRVFEEEYGDALFVPLVR
jgi:protein-L-isoaspartate(D-aspartate) O-methyltransferase